MLWLYGHQLSRIESPDAENQIAADLCITLGNGASWILIIGGLIAIAVVRTLPVDSK